jgi:hypothetical protein
MGVLRSGSQGSVLSRGIRIFSDFFACLYGFFHEGKVAGKLRNHSPLLIAEFENYLHTCTPAGMVVRKKG